MQVAQFKRNGEALSGAEDQDSTLEFCFDSPKDRTVNHKPLIFQFKGWAVSFDDGPVSLQVSYPDGHKETHAAQNPRPDVKNHFANFGKNASDSCGFEFSVDIPQTPRGDFSITIEIVNDHFSSGPQRFTAKEFTSMRWPPPADKPVAEESRANYKDTWNLVSESENDAKISVAGYTQESEFDRTAQYTLDVLQRSVGISPQDCVLEIGCGVARMARILSPLCKKWIGADVSENMLNHAKKRVGDLNNIEFVSLNGWDLSPVADASIDVVYCTVVFMHLDEWDRFNYICEAKRVLKPGGRLYVDNYNLLSKQGWDFFMKNMLDYHPMQRPPNISKSSTPQELAFFLQKAGFENISSDEDDEMWVYAWGNKP